MGDYSHPPLHWSPSTPSSSHHSFNHHHHHRGNTNPPSLYDTSTSTTESWSTGGSGGGGGRRTKNSKHHTKNGVTTEASPSMGDKCSSPSNYQSKSSHTRSSPSHSSSIHSTQFQDSSSQLPSYALPSPSHHSGRQQRQRSPSPKHAQQPRQQQEYSSRHSRTIGQTPRKAEQGNADYHKFLASVNRFARMEQEYMDNSKEHVAPSPEDYSSRSNPSGRLDRTSRPSEGQPEPRQASSYHVRSSSTPRSGRVPPQSPTSSNVSDSRGPSLKTPSPSRIRELQSRLFTESGELKGARGQQQVPPPKQEQSRTYHARKVTPYASERRPTRSLSPGQRRPQLVVDAQAPPQEHDPQDGQPFNDKYYQAALAARMQKSPTNFPTEVVSKTSSFSSREEEAFFPSGNHPGAARTKQPQDRTLGKLAQSPPPQEPPRTMSNDATKATRPNSPYKDPMSVRPRSHSQHSRQDSWKLQAEGHVGRGTSPTNNQDASARGQSQARISTERLRQFSQETIPGTPQSSASSRYQHSKTRVTVNRGVNDSMDSIERLALEFTGNTPILNSSELVAPPPVKKQKEHQDPRSSPTMSDARHFATLERRLRESSVDRSNQNSGSRQQQAKPSPVAPSSKPPLARSPSPSSMKKYGDPSPSPIRVTRSEAQTGAEKRDIAQLVARLTAINRENPAMALAQIDTILQQESRSTSGSPDAFVALQGINVDEDIKAQRESAPDDDDDDSTVSSMTNPTFVSDQVKIKQTRQPPPGSPSNPINTAGLEPVQKDQHTTPNSFVQPSTSSFRRPRPSTLQKFGGLSHEASNVPQPQQPHDGAALNRAKEKRLHFGKTPPQAKNNVNPTEIPEEPTEEVAKVELDVTSPASSQGDLDSFIRYREELATKIKNWDEMSNGLPKSRPTEPEEQDERLEALARNFRGPRSGQLPTPPAGDIRRKQPWDSEIPARAEKVDIRDTSMDGETGIELEMTTRGSNDYYRTESRDFEDQRFEVSPGVGQQRPRPFQRLNAAASPPPPSPSPSPSSSSRPSPARSSLASPAPPSRLLKDRQLQNTSGNPFDEPEASEGLEGKARPVSFPSPSLLSRPSPRARSSAASPAPPSRILKDRRSQNANANPFDEPEVSEGLEVMAPLSTLQKENAEKISADFDSAWVSMQPPSFFPDELDGEENAQSEKSYSHRISVERRTRSRSQPPPRHGRSTPVDLDTSFDTENPSNSIAASEEKPVNQSMEKGAIEVSLLDSSFGANTSGDASAPSPKRGGAPRACTRSLVKSSGKKKGFLRAFMRRSEKKQKSALDTKTSISANSVSQGSAGAHSLPTDLHRTAGRQPSPDGIHDATSRHPRMTPAIPLHDRSVPHYTHESHRPQPHLRMLPLPPGMDPSKEMDLPPPTYENQRGRGGPTSGRYASRSRSQPRSQSIERFRNPRMAQKFNRVMRLYEQDQ